ncbi:MAG TPA: dihydroxyacetone kinase subunit DhaL [Synergistaceae bacterium]|nr:dihydroxyacetone kinase subunit DhaL [Synergistaceae bacterium]
MTRGFSKAREKIDGGEYATIGALCKDVAMVMMSSVGGASGPLYGTFFLKASQKLSVPEADTELLVEAFEDGLQGIQALGKAVTGDKTMVDAMTPAVRVLRESAEAGEPLAVALEKAVSAARRGMEDTTPMVARKGRASYLGARSAGHQDPGATSVYLLLSALAEHAKG